MTIGPAPLFAEEGWPWAHICAHLPLRYMWDAYHSMCGKQCHVCTWDPNQGTPGHQSRTCALNPCATRLAPFKLSYSSFCQVSGEPNLYLQGVRIQASLKPWSAQGLDRAACAGAEGQWTVIDVFSEVQQSSERRTYPWFWFPAHSRLKGHKNQRNCDMCPE